MAFRKVRSALFSGRHFVYAVTCTHTPTSNKRASSVFQIIVVNVLKTLNRLLLPSDEGINSKLLWLLDIDGGKIGKKTSLSGPLVWAVNELVPMQEG